MGGQALLAHGWFLEPTPSAPQRWEHCRWWLTQITNRVSPSFFFFGLALLLVSQPVAMYHLTHSITSAFYMDNIYLKGTFLAGKRNKTEGTFLAGKRNKSEGTLLAVKRNKTEGTFLAGKRNFQGTSQPLRDCVNSFIYININNINNQIY